MGTTAVTAATGAQIADTDTVFVERLIVGPGTGNIVTTHAAADCPGITPGASVVPAAYGDATGDLFCPAGCIDIPARDWAALLGTTDTRKTILSGKALDDQAQRAADADAAKVTKRTRNDASEKQMAFIGSLLEAKGLGDQAPVDVLYTTDNAAKRRDGKLTKAEASKLIDFLMKLDDVANDVPAEVAAMPAADVEAWMAGFGRKLDQSDLDALDDDTAASIEAAAKAWAIGQQGVDFAWLADIAAKAAAGKWTPRYTKGTLNCWAAAVRRGETATAPKAATTAPVDLEAIEGIHKIDDQFVKLQSNRAGTQHYCKVLVDGDWEYDGKRLIRRLSADTMLPEAEAREFGHLYGKCGVCGTKLTQEASIEAGIGPVCASRF